MPSNPESSAECVLTEVIASEEIEVLPDVHAGFRGWSMPILSGSAG